MCVPKYNLLSLYNFIHTHTYVRMNMNMYVYLYMFSGQAILFILLSTFLSSLCRVEASWSFLCLIWHVYKYTHIVLMDFSNLA